MRQLKDAKTAPATPDPAGKMIAADKQAGKL